MAKRKYPVRITNLEEQLTLLRLIRDTELPDEQPEETARIVRIEAKITAAIQKRTDERWTRTEDE